MAFGSSDKSTAGQPSLLSTNTVPKIKPVNGTKQRKTTKLAPKKSPEPYGDGGVIGKAAGDVLPFNQASNNRTSSTLGDSTYERLGRGRRSRGTQSATDFTNPLITGADKAKLRRGGRYAAGAAIGAGLGATWKGSIDRGAEKQGQRQASVTHAQEKGRATRARKKREAEEALAAVAGMSKAWDRSDTNHAIGGAALGGITGYYGLRYKKGAKALRSVGQHGRKVRDHHANEALKFRNAAKESPGNSDMLFNATDSIDQAQSADRSQRMIGQGQRAMDWMGNTMIAGGAAMPAANVYGGRKTKRSTEENLQRLRQQSDAAGRDYITKALQQGRAERHGPNAKIPSGARRGRRVTE